MIRKMLIAGVMALGAQVGAARQPETGYRGFVEWNNSASLDISLYGGPTDSRFYTGVSTTHGCQVKPWLFVGGGAAVEFWPKYGQAYTLPVYGAARIDLGRRRVSPFLDVRLGGNIIRGGGVYFSPSIGLRFHIIKEWAINLSVGYTMTGRHQRYDSWEDFKYGEGWLPTYDGRHTWDDLFSFRLGVEF